MSQRQHINEALAMGEYGWQHYQGRLWSNIPAYMRVCMAYVHPAAAWRASDEALKPTSTAGLHHVFLPLQQPPM